MLFAYDCRPGTDIYELLHGYQLSDYIMKQQCAERKPSCVLTCAFSLIYCT